MPPAEIIECSSTTPKACFSCSSSSSLSASSSSWQEDIQLAIQDSKLGQSSIDTAHLACSRWESILDQNNVNQESNDQNPGSNQVVLPTSVQTLCFAMYASCLVRTGRDDKAIDIYEQALGLLNDRRMDPTARDLLLGKAKAHQRLLQYSDAFDAYSELVDMARNSKNPLDTSDVIGAVTCSLRMQQPQRAQEILLSASNLLNKEHQAEEAGTDEQRKRLQTDISRMKIVLSILNHCTGTMGKSNMEQMNPPISLLRNEYPLYVWLHDLRLLQNIQQETAPPVSAKSVDVDSVKSANAAFLTLMKINQSPWDDPLLLQLDDKVLLHRLLSLNKSNTSKFWPKGYVVPTDADDLMIQYDQETRTGRSASDHKWIAKSRAGYGSHGNQIMSLEEAMMKKAGSDGDSHSTTASQAADEFLLQELVDPTLLITGRKFSLRLYVVYFNPQELYLSNQGLVKLAAMEAAEDGSSQGDESARRAFMTNSGREQHMAQHDLRFLQHESGLFETKAEYASFWSKIEDSIKEVMKSYREYRCQCKEFAEQEDFESRRQALGIPKILGLDYLVDTEYQPWLLEVNRFPGLEPRDESDRLVKHQIVRDAWLCAQGRQIMEASEESKAATSSGDHHPLQYLLDQLPPVAKECPYSLERLH